MNTYYIDLTTGLYYTKPGDNRIAHTCTATQLTMLYIQNGSIAPIYDIDGTLPHKRIISGE